MPRRKFCCSFCHISFRSIWKLNTHHNLHLQHPPVACNLCPLKFTHYGELGIHIRQAHSDDIITRFVEFTKRNFIKNIQLMETNTNSDSDWLNTSREQSGITSCEEVQCLEKDDRRVKEDYQCKDESRVKIECECMDESGISFTKEINELIEQNGNEASNNENRLREPNLNGISKDCINDGKRKDVNTFVKARQIPYNRRVTDSTDDCRSDVNTFVTARQIPYNRRVTDSTDDCRSDVNTFVTARQIPYNRRVTDSTDDCRSDVNTFVTARQIPYNRRVTDSTDDCRSDVNTFVTARPIPYNRRVTDSTDDCRSDVNRERCQVSFRLLGNLESKTKGNHHMNANLVDKVPATSNKYTELQKMKSVHVRIEPLRSPQRRVCNDPPSSETCQHSKTTKQIKEIAQLTVHDEIRSTGHTEWTEAIHKLKRSFRQKRKRDKDAKFISDPESFSNWLTANLPVDGIICGCGRHLKTVKAITVHLHRKSRTALKNVKIFKKSIVYNP
ncbi:uncharacterized protein [Mytilus edulis]|uniref:uncharacterized protein n=1 Tax=Mytilus edulis TaxID=6550 RepID=UPI0039EE6796